MENIVFAVIACDNIECAKPTIFYPQKGDKIPYSRCGKCMRNYYCSKDCQAHDWKRLHKGTCDGSQVECNYRTYLNNIPDISEIPNTGVYCMLDLVTPGRITALIELEKMYKSYFEPDSKTNDVLQNIPIMSSCKNMFTLIRDTYTRMGLTRHVIFQIRGLFIIHSGK